MGFSVSGSAAIIFASMFIAFGVWFTAASNSYERVTEAEDDRSEAALETKNTDIELVNASYNDSTLYVKANNTGASQLTLSETDLLIDGVYETGWQPNGAIEGDASTDLWLAGQQLVIELTVASQPDRVKLVADTGVADTREVVSL